MVVLHSLPAWLPLTENWIYYQLHSLPPSIENHIACQKVENLDQYGVPHIHAFRAGSPVLSFLKRLINGAYGYPLFVAEILKKSRAEILHSHFGNVAWSNLKASKHAKKHVAAFYGYDVNYLPVSLPIWVERYRELFEEVDGVLCEGSQMAQSLVRLGCPHEKIHVHHLGVVLDEISFRPRTWNPSERLRVLMAASFQEKKGIPDALKALASIREKIPVEITLIGDANREERSQKEKNRILETISNCDLKNNIHLLGYQPRCILFEEAYRHHIFLASSRTASDADTEGGLPVVLLEMMASGMPVVSTRHCDIPDAVQHEKTGLLSKEGDIQGIASNVLWWASHPERWLDILGTARRHIEDQYDVRKQGVKLGQIYDELLRL